MSAVVRKRKRTVTVGSALTENEEKAYELRSAGASYREIANALNFSSASSALEAVKRAIAKTQFESATESLLMDLANIDDWTKRATHRLRTTGDLNQINTLLRLMDKKHALLGVDSTTLSERMGKKKTAGGATIVVSPSEVGFIQGLMASVGVDPDSPEAQKFLKGARTRDAQKELPAAEVEGIPMQKPGRKVLRKKRAGKKSTEVADLSPSPRTPEVEVGNPVHAAAPVVEEVGTTAVEADTLYYAGTAPALRESSI